MQSCDLDLLKEMESPNISIMDLKLLDLVCNGLQNFLLNFLFFDNCVLGYFLHTNTSLLSPPPVLPMSSFFKELFIFGFARILHIDFQKGKGKVLM